jgi:hypothetical protein
VRPEETEVDGRRAAARPWVPSFCGELSLVVARGDAKSPFECTPESIRRFESKRSGDRFN